MAIDDESPCGTIWTAEETLDYHRDAKVYRLDGSSHEGSVRVCYLMTGDAMRSLHAFLSAWIEAENIREDTQNA